MAQHYGLVISPTRPGEPRHKGRVENGVHYLERDFMAGQDFEQMVVGRERLAVWVKETAGMRMHGTRHEPPLLRFERAEAYIGERVVEIYAGVELLTTHPRAKEKGEWHTRLEHYPPEKAAYLEKTPQRCWEIAAKVGPATTRVVELLLAERPLDRLRSVQAILRLEETVGRQRLEAACTRALHFGDVRYRRVRDILNAGLDLETLPGKVVALPPRRYAFARPVEELLGAVGLPDEAREGVE